MDTERASPFKVPREWTPARINIFGHQITIDIPTGNILISVNDVSYPYYGFTLGIARKYDLQEQYMQRTYLREYPNVDPKPHWFGNWQFAYEADVDEVWQNTFSELHLTSGVGANGLFKISPPDFKRGLEDEVCVENTLRTYGIPGRTLIELLWKFTENDFLLRTQRGPFQILTGNYRDETLVDEINAKMWLFNPISGVAFHVSSEYFFNIRGDKHRDVGYPLIVAKIVDALGHSIELKPLVGTPPFRKYVLSDGSGREFYIDLDEELTYIDGLNPRGEVRKYLVSKVVDNTKATHNEFDYKYNAKHLLREVIFPSTIGNRYVRYHYEDPNYPWILTAIENFQGHKIHFEYIEDPTDNDKRLNPRLKIKKIIDPEGITFEYEYDHINLETIVTISVNGTIDRKVKYRYIRDIHDTKQRYITTTEIEVKRGYLTDLAGNVVPRQPDNPQIVRYRTEYTTDGRFNVEKKYDPLNRFTRNKYNDYNQLEKVWDFDNHWTEYIYDIPDNPSKTNPRKYDLLYVKQENILRTVDLSSPSRPLVETVEVITKEYEYDKYDVHNSPDNTDHGIQSTHRIYTETDKRDRSLVWTYTYDDLNSHNPLSPTLIESPLKIMTQKKYNNRGYLETIIDPKNNIYTYSYNAQGQLEHYIDPNQENISLTYYPGGNWLRTFEDQSSKITEFVRQGDGRLKKIIDPVGDSVDYDYYKNNRLCRIIHHRPPVPQDPNDPSSPSLITAYQNLETEIRYSPLGDLTSLKNPKGLELIFSYDEAGRVYQWYHNVPNPKRTKFVYDAAGQLIELVDRKGKSTVYAYYYSGLVKTVQHPDWNDGTNDVAGKLVEVKKYDYLGRVLSVVDSEIAGSKKFMYDEAGNLVLRRDPDGFELTFDYDDDGRLWRVKDASDVYKLELALDGLGRPESLKDSATLDGSLLWEYKYEKQAVDDSGHPITKVLNLFKRSLSAIGLVSAFDYDEKNRLRAIAHKWDGLTSTSIYSQNIYSRDDDLIESITGNDPNKFRYDGIKQLIREEFGNLTSDYDEAGNRLYRTDKTANPNPAINVHNELNHLKEDKGLPAIFTYDENGNRLTSTYPVNPTEFCFDGVNRLRLIKNSRYEISYLYDNDGKLVERAAKDIASGTIENTRFSYLLSKPILVKRNGNVFMLLTWDTNGKLLRIRREQPNGGGNVYRNSLLPLYDGLGNIVRFVDGDKNIPVEVTYDAWGDIQNLIDPRDLFVLVGYRGGILDRLSGYILFGARWYSPKIGRWISSDPLLLGSHDSRDYLQLGNLYSYVLNDPVNEFDPTGLSAEDIQAVVGWLQRNYPELFPEREVSITEGDPGKGRGGLTNPITGNITVAPSHSRAQLAGTIAHELLHARQSLWDRLGQAVRFAASELLGVGRGEEEHQFIYDIEQAVWAHYALEEKAGQPINKTRLEESIQGRLIFLPNGAPAIVYQGIFAQFKAGIGANK